MNTALIRLVGADRLYTDFMISGGLDTLVGSTFSMKNTTRKSTSTIGGIVKIDDHTYAVTIIHDQYQDHQDSTTAPSVDGYLSEETLAAIENNTDLEPPLVIDTWASEDKTDDWDINTTSLPDSLAGDDDSTQTWSSMERLIQFGEWALIPIVGRQIQPNSYVLPQSPDPKSELRYIVDLSEEPGQFPVSILSSVSAAKMGMLSRNFSFLVSENAVSQEEFIDDLIALSLGDSGSWVVKQSNNALIGSVTATSPGVAYAVPVSDFMQKARQHFGHDARISIPPPFVTFLDMSREGPHITRDENVKQATSTSCLEASIKDPVAQYMLNSVKNGKVDEVERLVEQMNFDHEGLKKLFENVLRQDSRTILGYNQDILVLAQSIAGDGKNPDTESQNSSKVAEPSIPWGQRRLYQEESVSCAGFLKYSQGAQAGRSRPDRLNLV
ncbi:hypothetical protein PG993_012403 [Apiospora rasikravindrae]|uniref:Uncharacterized protein n=1 Tax=Apiospora rasikravindrae TaxID=990691 RepID=A0ABR1S3P6_9PEZI